MAWDALTPADKEEVLAAFPPGSHIPASGPEDEAKPDIARLKNDDTFRYDCASFTENLALGRFEPDWLESAWAAHQRKKMGDYDEFVWRRFEEVWETVLPEEFKVKRVTGAGEKEDANRVDGAKEADGSTENVADEVGDHEQKPGDANLRQDTAVKVQRNHEEGPHPESEAHEDKEQPPTRHEARSQSTAAEEDSGAHEGEETRAKTGEDGDRMVIDELQAGDSPQNKQHTPLVRRPNLKMEADGEESADELA